MVLKVSLDASFISTQDWKGIWVKAEVNSMKDYIKSVETAH
jgi:hypothetical protein